MLQQLMVSVQEKNGVRISVIHLVLTPDSSKSAAVFFTLVQ